MMRNDREKAMSIEEAYVRLLEEIGPGKHKENDDMILCIVKAPCKA